jgi:hypothetical protein
MVRAESPQMLGASLGTVAGDESLLPHTTALYSVGASRQVRDNAPGKT